MKKRQKIDAAGRELAVVKQDQRTLAETLRAVKDIEADDLKAAYCLETMLGGLEMLRMGADQAEAWGIRNRGLGGELAEHFDAVECALKKYLDGILCGKPERAAATA